MEKILRVLEEDWQDPLRCTNLEQAFQRAGVPFEDGARRRVAEAVAGDPRLSDLLRWHPSAYGVVLLALVASGVAGLRAARPPGGRGVAPATVLLPPGVTEVALAEDGSRAVAVTVTFDRKRGVPGRAVVVVETPAGRVLWRANLPAVSCCDLPVFSTTEDARQVAVGGAQSVDVFRSDGVRVACLDLGRVGSLNNALQMWADGRGLVAGQVDGELKAFALPAPRLLWRTAVDSALLGLVLNEASGEVLALTAEGFVGLEVRGGTVRYRVPARGVPAAAASAAGRGFVVAWKGADEVLGVGFLEGGSWRWQRTLGRVTVPLLEADPSARWVAVSDFLATQRGCWVLGDGCCGPGMESPRRWDWTAGAPWPWSGKTCWRSGRRGRVPCVGGHACLAG